MYKELQNLSKSQDDMKKRNQVGEFTVLDLKASKPQQSNLGDRSTRPVNTMENPETDPLVSVP